MKGPVNEGLGPVYRYSKKNCMNTSISGLFIIVVTLYYECLFR
jgi:hypothetical protein